MSEGTDLVVVDQPAPMTVFGTDDPVGIVQRVSDIATPLAAFIKAKHMSMTIGDREYVLAEGWSFMGAMLGVSPRAVSVTELRDAEGHVCGFEAKVELLTRDGAIVGGAIAECSSYESNWRDRDAFALKSMAQTRATGKAYRMAFGFVMKAAGYEATPAEEMDSAQTRRIVPPRARMQVDSGEFRNVGELLTWAVQKQGQTRAGVLELLGVKEPREIADLAKAKQVIEDSLAATRRETHEDLV